MERLGINIPTNGDICGKNMGFLELIMPANVKLVLHTHRSELWLAVRLMITGGKFIGLSSKNNDGQDHMTFLWKPHLGGNIV